MVLLLWPLLTPMRRHPCALLVGMQIGAVIVETVMGFPQKMKIELSYDPGSPLLGMYPEKMRNFLFFHILSNTYHFLSFLF